MTSWQGEIRALFDGEFITTVDMAGIEQADPAMATAHSLFRARDAWLPPARRIGPPAVVWPRGGSRALRARESPTGEWAAPLSPAQRLLRATNSWELWSPPVSRRGAPESRSGPPAPPLPTHADVTGIHAQSAFRRRHGQTSLRRPVRT
jgi:hypothetical protein